MLETVQVKEISVTTQELLKHFYEPSPEYCGTFIRKCDHDLRPEVRTSDMWLKTWMNKNTYWQKTTKYSRALLANCWKPLENSVCWLDWGKRELRTIPAASSSCYLAPPASPGRRSPQRRDASPPRHNLRRCMSGICPVCCRDQCSTERMTPVLVLRQRDTVMSGCTLADSSADAKPGSNPGHGD